MAALGCSSPKICKLGSSECGDGQSCVQGECKACPKCGEGQRCVAAQCLAETCNGTVCPAGTGCVNGACVDESCVGVICPSDQQCSHGACVGTSCNGVACRSGEVCDEGACTPIACVGVRCPAGEVCANGACTAQSCNGSTCATGAACVNGSCVDTRCVGVVCVAGYACAGGICEPTSCNGVPCAPGQVCLADTCTDASCVGVVCAGGTCSQGICSAPGACKEGDAPIPCGETGSSCVQSCVNGQRIACQPPSGAVDTLSDPANCGQCGHVCAAPAGANAACRSGVCGRGACVQGHFDFDQQQANGCEVTCIGATCTDASGTPIPVTVAPVPETGITFQEISSATSLGGFVQTSSTHTNFAVLADPTPLFDGAAIESSNTNYRNTGGIGAVLRGAPP